MMEPFLRATPVIDWDHPSVHISTRPLFENLPDVVLASKKDSARR